MATPVKLLAEYIDLPKAVHKTDFVVTLTTGIADPERTIKEYEPTPQLVTCFDSALSLVAASVRDRKSRSAFLHGSFGSGKSHFMAILDLLLDGNPQARSIPQLGPVVAKHNADLQGRKILVVPFHFVGKESMEQVVLGGYVSHIATKHPEAPAPGVYVGDQLIDGAVTQRAEFGDTAFFASLSKAKGSNDGWGELGGSWDATRFDAAVAAPAGSIDRAQLVSALLDTIFSVTKGMAEATASGYVSFEQGLEVISTHAKALGYDALVFFCDELVLWLASRIAERDFVGRESQKLAKLVDADHAKRPLPIVSFIARQRDLRELVGDHNVGSEQQAVSDALRFWEGRFDTITLEDRNLPLIAQKRLLRPRSEAASLAIDEVFAKVRQTTETRGEFDVLLTDTASADDFRKLYPFSPALVDALVALSGAMQRERTALKAMAQLLSDQRNTLELGQLVPAGDLFDVMAQGEEPLSPTMANQFRAAKKLWAEQFVPMLARTHALTEQQIFDLPGSVAVGHVAGTDARLIKTLLIAALVPEVAPLRNLTVSRLTALNSGTVKGFVTGAERKTVLGKVRDWAAEIGELRVGDDDHNPTVSLQLTGIDVASIIDSVRSIDNRDLRRHHLRDLLSKEMGLTAPNLMGAVVEVEWRGTKRKAEVVFANVRDVEKTPDALFTASEFPKIVIDYPFDDDPSETPYGDHARVEGFLGSQNSQWTMCWLPNFFTETLKKQFGDCVVLDYLLKGSTFDTNAGHLSPADRDVARTQLKGQLDALTGRVLAAARQAYGLVRPEGNLVEEVLASHEQFSSLHPSMVISPPAAPTLRGAIEAIAGDMWKHHAPKHPQYSALVTRPELVHTLDIVRRATQEPNGRLDNIDRNLRAELQKIVPALQLGVMGDAHFVVGQHWKDHFERLLAEEKPSTVTVRLLRSWIDRPEVLALPPDHADLVIASFIVQTNRILQIASVETTPEINKLHNDGVVLSRDLPSETDWSVARSNAMQLGLTVPSLVSPASVAALDLGLSEFVQPHHESARVLVDRLVAWCRQFGVSESGNARLKTSRSALDFVTTVQAKRGSAVSILTTFKPATSFAAMATSLGQANAVVGSMDRAGFGSIAPALEVTGNWLNDAATLRSLLVEALAIEEHAGADSLATVIAQVHSASQDLLARVVKSAGAGTTTAPLPALGVPPIVLTAPVEAAVVLAAASTWTRADAEVELERIRDRMRAELSLDLSYQLVEVPFDSISPSDEDGHQ